MIEFIEKLGLKDNLERFPHHVTQIKRRYFFIFDILKIVILHFSKLLEIFARMCYNVNRKNIKTR